jgi:hypothetical protein
MKLRLSYANVVSTIALFLVLGGGAYAALHLKKNSVKSRNIVNGQVKNQDLAANAVRGGKVKDDSLGGNDVDESSLGEVPQAAQAGSAGIADNATNATNATEAANADKLDNLDSTAFGSVLTARITNIGTPPNDAVNEAAPISGVNLPGTGQETMLSPPRPMVARDLTVEAAPGANPGDTEQVVFFVNGNGTNLNCTVTFANGTSCQNTGAAIPVPASSHIFLKIILFNNGPNPDTHSLMVTTRLTSD